MIRYFDSSFILARLLEQETDPKLGAFWRASGRRLSSSLLRIECVIGVRRAARLVGPDADRWAAVRVAALDRVMASVSFVNVDSPIEAIIRDTPMLAECRALDAIHLATALLVSRLEADALQVVTLDKRMGRLARKLGMVAVPA